MSHLRTVVEATWVEDGEEVQEKYYLLHWGLKYDLIPDPNDNFYPVHFTVAICQHYKTGVIETFLPTQLRILGVNLKE